jgi:hypothetical protein
MSLPPCALLDDFLARNLGGADLARFTAHVPGCAACQQAVRQQERLDALLVAAVEQLPIPAGLTERVHRRLRAARRRRLAVVAGALSAAAAVAAIWFFGPWALRPALPTDLRAKAPPIPAAAPRPTMYARVSFSDVNVRAVSIPTESPNVTVVWVFPGPRPTPAPPPVERFSVPTERSDP